VEEVQNWDMFGIKRAEDDSNSWRVSKRQRVTVFWTSARRDADTVAEHPADTDGQVPQALPSMWGKPAEDASRDQRLWAWKSHAASKKRAKCCLLSPLLTARMSVCGRAAAALPFPTRLPSPATPVRIQSSSWIRDRNIFRASG